MRNSPGRDSRGQNVFSIHPNSKFSLDAAFPVRPHRTTMLSRGTRLRAIPVLRGKPPRFLFCAYQTRVPLHLRSLDSNKLALPSSVSQRASFSTGRSIMAAQKIDGTAIAKGIREKINAEIQEKQRSNPRYKPSLVIIQGTKPFPRAIGSYTNTNSQLVIGQTQVCSCWSL